MICTAAALSMFLIFAEAMLPPCGQTSPGQECTTHGAMLTVSFNDATNSCTNSFQECLNRHSNDCENKLTDCKTKVQNGDRNPDVGIQTFGYTLSSGGGSIPSDTTEPSDPPITGPSSSLVAPNEVPPAEPTTGSPSEPSIPPSDGGNNNGLSSSDNNSKFEEIPGGMSGEAKTTRYWDCCKPSCAWKDNVNNAQGLVNSCDAKGNPLSDIDAKSICEGGPSAACLDQTPFIDQSNSDLAFGFSAVSQKDMCCKCFELSFTTMPQKKMVVQITNTGTDVSLNQFDIAIPGGGVGLFNGCKTQFGEWDGGVDYGGVSDVSGCDKLPNAELSQKCKFRFEFWGENHDNPSATYKEVKCPAVLTSRTGCTPNY